MFKPGDYVECALPKCGCGIQGEVLSVSADGEDVVIKNMGHVLTKDLKLFAPINIYDDPDIKRYKPDTAPSKPKSECECGAHAVGYNTHSSWCPLSKVA